MKRKINKINKNPCKFIKKEEPFSLNYNEDFTDKAKIVKESCPGHILYSPKIKQEVSYQDSAFGDVIKFMNHNWDLNIGRLKFNSPNNNNLPNYFQNFEINKRLPYALDFIKQHKPDIITLQEGRKCEAFGNKYIDSITPTLNMLIDLGYNVSIQSLAPGDKSFRVITATKNNRFEFIEARRSYINKNPDYSSNFIREDITDTDKQIEALKEYNYGEIWERCLSVSIFKDSFVDKNIAIFNVHCPIQFTARIQACKLLNEMSTSLLDQDEEINILIAGDFNSFPQNGGSEQINIIKNLKFNNKLVLKYAMKNAVYTNGEKVSDTFFAYISDFADKLFELQENGTMDYLKNLKDEDRMEEFRNKTIEIFREN